MVGRVFGGNVWFTSGVDSVSTKKSDGTPIEPPIWCRHDSTGSDFEETYTHIICTECCRQFQKVHPVTAEQIIRDRDATIIRMQAMIGNA